MMAFNEPHLTRLCHFVWKPINKTIRITLDHGLRRQLSWVGLRTGDALKGHQAELVSSPDGLRNPSVGKA